MDKLLNRYPNLNASWPTPITALFKDKCPTVRIKRSEVGEKMALSIMQVVYRSIPPTSHTIQSFNDALLRMQHRFIDSLIFEREVALHYPYETHIPLDTLRTYPVFAEEERELNHYLYPPKDAQINRYGVRISPPRPISLAMKELILSMPLKAPNDKKKEGRKLKQAGKRKELFFVYKFKMFVHHIEIGTMQANESHYTPPPNMLPVVVHMQRQIIRELHIHYPDRFGSQAMMEYEEVVYMPTMWTYVALKLNPLFASLLDPARCVFPFFGMKTHSDKDDYRPEHPFVDKLPRKSDGSFEPMPHMWYDNSTAPRVSYPFQHLPDFNPHRLEQCTVPVIGANGQLSHATLPIPRSAIGISPYDHGGYCREMKGYNVPGTYTDRLSHDFWVIENEKINGVDKKSRFVGFHTSSQPVHNFNPRLYSNIYIFVGSPTCAYPEHRRGTKTFPEMFRLVELRMTREWNEFDNPKWETKRLTISDTCIKTPSPSLYHTATLFPAEAASLEKKQKPWDWSEGAAEEGEEGEDGVESLQKMASDVLMETCSMRSFDNVQETEKRRGEGFLPHVEKLKYHDHPAQKWSSSIRQASPRLPLLPNQRYNPTCSSSISKAVSVKIQRKVRFKKSINAMVDVEDEPDNDDEDEDDPMGQDVDNASVSMSMDDGEENHQSDEEPALMKSLHKRLKTHKRAPSPAEMDARSLAETTLFTETDEEKEDASKVDQKEFVDPSILFLRPGEHYSLIHPATNVYDWSALDEMDPLGNYFGVHEKKYESFIRRMQTQVDSETVDEDAIRAHIQFYKTYETIPFGVLLLALGVGDKMDMVSFIERHETDPLVAAFIWATMKRSFQYNLGITTCEEARIYIGNLSSPPVIDSLVKIYRCGDIVLNDRFYSEIVYTGENLQHSGLSREEKYRREYEWIAQHKWEIFMLETMHVIKVTYGFAKPHINRANTNLKFVTGGDTLDFNMHWGLSFLHKSIKTQFNKIDNLGVFMFGDPSYLVGMRKVVRDGMIKRNRTATVADICQNRHSILYTNLMQQIDEGTEDGLISTSFTKRIQFYPTRDKARCVSIAGTSPLYNVYQPHNEAKAVEGLCKISNLNSQHTTAPDRRTKPDGIGLMDQLETQLNLSGGINQKLCIGNWITTFECKYEVQWIIGLLRLLSSEEFFTGLPSELPETHPQRPWIRVLYKLRPIGYTLYPRRIVDVLERIKNRPQSSARVHAMSIFYSDLLGECVGFRLDQGLVVFPLLRVNTEDDTITMPLSFLQAHHNSRDGRLPVFRPHHNSQKINSQGVVDSQYEGHDYTLPVHEWFRDLMDAGTIAYCSNKTIEYEQVGSSTQQTLSTRYCTIHGLMNSSPSGLLMQNTQHCNPARQIPGCKKVHQSNDCPPMCCSLYGDLHDPSKPTYYMLWPQRAHFSEATGVSFMRPLVGSLMRFAMICDGFNMDDSVTAVDTAHKNAVVSMIPHGFQGKVFVGLESLERAIYTLMNAVTPASTKECSFLEAHQMDGDESQPQKKKGRGKRKADPLSPVEEKEEAEASSFSPPPEWNPSFIDKQREDVFEAFEKLGLMQEEMKFRSEGMLYIRGPTDTHTPLIMDQTLLQSKSVQRNSVLRDSIFNLVKLDGWTQTLRVGQSVLNGQVLASALRIYPCDIYPVIEKLKSTVSPSFPVSLSQEHMQLVQSIYLDKISRQETCSLTVPLTESNSILSEIHYIPTYDVNGTFLMTFKTASIMQTLGTKVTNYFLDKGVVSLVLKRFQAPLILSEGGTVEMNSNISGVPTRRNQVRNIKSDENTFFIYQPDAKSLRRHGIQLCADASFCNEFYRPDEPDVMLKQVKKSYGSHLSAEEWKEVEDVEFTRGCRRDEDWEISDRHLNPASPGSGWATYEGASTLFGDHPVLVNFQRKKARQYREALLFMKKWFSCTSHAETTTQLHSLRQSALPYHTTFSDDLFKKDLKDHGEWVDKMSQGMSASEKEEFECSWMISQMPSIVKQTILGSAFCSQPMRRWMTTNLACISHTKKELSDLGGIKELYIEDELEALLEYYQEAWLDKRRTALHESAHTNEGRWPVPTSSPYAKEVRFLSLCAYSSVDQQLSVEQPHKHLDDIFAFWKSFIQPDHTWFQEKILPRLKDSLRKEYKKSQDMGVEEFESYWQTWQQDTLHPAFSKLFSSLVYGAMNDAYQNEKVHPSSDSFALNFERLQRRERERELRRTIRIIYPTYSKREAESLVARYSESLEKGFPNPNRHVANEVFHLKIRHASGQSVRLPMCSESWMRYMIDLGAAEMDPVLLRRQPRARKEVWHSVCRSGSDGMLYRSKVLVGSQFMHQIGVSAEMSNKTFLESSLDWFTLEPNNLKIGEQGYMEYDTTKGSGAANVNDDTNNNNSIKFLYFICIKCFEIADQMIAFNRNIPPYMRVALPDSMVKRILGCRKCNHQSREHLRPVYMTKILALKHFLGTLNTSVKYLIKNAGEYVYDRFFIVT